MSSETTSTISTHLEEKVPDLSEVLRGQSAWINALDFTTEIYELGRVCRRRQRKRGEFDGHGLWYEMEFWW